MDTQEMVATVSSFLLDCTSEDRLGSFAIIEHRGEEPYFFQFMVCGDGSFQTEVMGAGYCQRKNPAHIENFDSLLKSGWDYESGNAQRFFQISTELAPIQALVTRTSEVLLALYGVKDQVGWKVDFHREE